MKLRDTVILVVLAHVGLVLIWICMGGCANDKAQEPGDEVAVVTPDVDENLDMPSVVPTEVPVDEPSTSLVLEEAAVAPIQPSVTLPTIPGSIPSPVPEPMETASSEETRYVVKKGDTLWAISRQFRVSVEAIVDRNDIQNPAMIREGRELIIPASAKSAETPKPESGLLDSAAEGSPVAIGTDRMALPVATDGETTIHTVQSGDTIWLLARHYKTTSDRIMQANDISDATRLQIGQRLLIPKGE